MAVRIAKNSALDTLSLAPLIDVVFLLVVFFLVTTRFAREDRELDVRLPDASEAKPLTVAPDEIFININRQGEYFVGRQRVALDELESFLVQAAANNPANQKVIVRADKHVELDYVVQAINLCKRAGIHEYMLNTQGS